MVFYLVLVLGGSFGGIVRVEYNRERERRFHRTYLELLPDEMKKCFHSISTCPPPQGVPRRYQYANDESPTPEPITKFLNCRTRIKNSKKTLGLVSGRVCRGSSKTRFREERWVVVKVSRFFSLHETLF